VAQSPAANYRCRKGNSLSIPADLRGDLEHDSLKLIHSLTITKARAAARPRRDFGASKDQWDTPQGKTLVKALRAPAKV